MKKESKNKKMEVSKKMAFADLLRLHPELSEILFEKGMHCLGCPMAMQETLEEGCLAHGLNPDKVVRELNEKLNKKGEKKRK